MSASAPGRLLAVAPPPVGDQPSARAIEALGTAVHVWSAGGRHVTALLEAAAVPAERISPIGATDPAAVVARVASGDTVAVVGSGPPAAPLVGAVVDAGLPLEVVPAPDAVVTALVASGLATDHVAVDAALPPAGPARAARLSALANERRTAALVGTGATLAATLADVAEACGPERPVAVVADRATWRGPVGTAAGIAPGDASAGGLGGRWGDADEVVVVVGAAPAPAAGEGREADDVAVRAALRAARARGLSPGRAAAEVAAALGRSRREVYALGTGEDG